MKKQSNTSETMVKKVETGAPHRRLCISGLANYF